MSTGSAQSSLTVDDMANIGRLVLDGGQRDGQRVIGSEGTKRTLHPVIAIGDSDPFASHYGLYCYLAAHERRRGRCA